MNGELFNGLGLSREMQQKLRKTSDTQLTNMLHKFGAFDTDDSNLSAKEKLRRRIREQENLRMGRAVPVKEYTPAPLEPVLSKEELEKRHKNRMKRLKQKYGEVTEKDYYDALEKTRGVQLQSLPKPEQEALQKYVNLVDLYNNQHENKEEERELDLDDY